MFRRSALVLVLTFALIGQALAGEKFRSDAAHSSATFSVRHMLVTNVPGRFNEMTVEVDYDAQDVTRSKVKAVIKTASINTQNERRDNHLRSADFFDAASHPEITFESARIERRGDSLVAIGPLTMRGVSKEIALPFELLGPVVDQRGRKRMGVEARITVNRFDWNVSYNALLEGGGAVVGRDVRIELNLELVQVPPEQPAAAAPSN